MNARWQETDASDVVVVRLADDTGIELELKYIAYGHVDSPWKTCSGIEQLSHRMH